MARNLGKYETTLPATRCQAANVTARTLNRGLDLAPSTRSEPSLPRPALNTKAYTVHVEAFGPALIVLSIPLILQWVPQNLIDGFRVPPTLRNKTVWYDANALCGRHMLLLGVMMVALEFLLPRAMRTPVLGIIGGIGLVGITIIDWRTANRWIRERKDRPSL